jgi:hypothetical protein
MANNQRNEEPKQEPWWLAMLGGLIMLGGAIWVYLDLTAFEAAGGTRRVNAIVALLYNYLGKWGVVGLMAVGGLGAIWHGVSQLNEGAQAPPTAPPKRKKGRMDRSTIE